MKKSTSSHYCCVPGCTNLYKRPLFTFPDPRRNLDRFKKWVLAVQNRRYKDLTPSQIYQRGYVCFAHFTSEDFLCEKTMKRLNSAAVPTLNLPGAKCGIEELLTPEPLNAANTADLPVETSKDPQFIKEHELLLNNFNLYDGKPLEDDPDDPEMLLRGALFRNSNVSDFPLVEPGPSGSCPITDEYIYIVSSIEPDQRSIESEAVGVSRKNVNSKKSLLELEHDYFLPAHEEDVGFEDSSDDDGSDCEVVSENDGSDCEVVSNQDFENVENQCTLNDYPEISEKPVSQEVMKQMSAEEVVPIETKTTYFDRPLKKLSSEELKIVNQYRLNVYSDIPAKPMPQKVVEEVVPVEAEKPYFKSVKSFLKDGNRMTEVCRICFQSLEEDDVIKLYEESPQQDTTQIKIMLKLVLPDLDLEIYPNTVICVKCVELLVCSYQLKEKWLSTEEKLQKIIEKKKGAINSDADLVIIGKRVTTQAEAEMDHSHIGNPPSEEQPESELAVALLQSLGVESNGKCLSESVSIFHGNIDANGFEDKPIRQIAVNSPELESCMCDQCGRMFTYKSSLLRHIETHNKPPKNLTRPLTKMCDTCGKLCTSEFTLKKHKRSHLEKKCPFCDQVFPNINQRHYHIYSKHKRRTYVCHLCGKQYSSRSCLRVHLTKHNPAAKNKTCYICSKKFFTTSLLRIHLNSHITEKSLKCEFCGKFLKHPWSLQKHIDIWHLNRAEHVCEFCNKKYRKKFDLERHRLHHRRDHLAELNGVVGSNEENCAVDNIVCVIETGF